MTLILVFKVSHNHEPQHNYISMPSNKKVVNFLNPLRSSITFQFIAFTVTMSGIFTLTRLCSYFPRDYKDLFHLTLQYFMNEAHYWENISRTQHSSLISYLKVIELCLNRHLIFTITTQVFTQCPSV